MTAASTVSKRASPTRSRHQSRQRRERFFLVGSLLLIAAAWLYGYFANDLDILPYVPEVVPGAVRVESQGELFLGYSAEGEILGYAAVGSAPGYSGPIELLVGMDSAGEVTGVQILKQRETPGFFRLVLESSLINQFLDQTVSAPFQIGEDLDAVSGATLSAEGVAASARQAIDLIAAEGLDNPRPQEAKPIQFGIPEITLIALFALGYWGHRMRDPKWKRRLRWVSLLSGMLILGFVYAAVFTIPMVIALISGYWPDWHNNLYWYLLLGGILFVTILDGKNPYCGWFCPFGAVQECLSVVTGAKLYRPKRYHELLKWGQRGLALTAVVIGLVLRRPGVVGYEPFGTLFNLQGSGLEWSFLALVLFAALIFFRPFCNLLCPLDPVVELIAAGRRWALELWKTWT